MMHEVSFPIGHLVYMLAALGVTAALDLIDGKFIYPNFKDEKRDSFLHGRFSQSFAWGAATSAYQIEGGWNDDGKGVHIWDTFTHQGGHVFMNQTGDIACDSYHKVTKDVEMLKRLGVTHYSFSISWTRILPQGTRHKPPNKAGLAYYHRLIDELIRANIEPVVTLFHYDMPQDLQDYLGGFQNSETVKLFVHYADLCFGEFGDKVKYWMTINEPYTYVMSGHRHGNMAPGFELTLQHCYENAHNILLAHALTWKHYHEKYRRRQRGFIGIASVAPWAEPATQKTADLEAANLYMQMTIGWFLHPLYYGDYPAEMRQYVASQTSVKLPEFTRQERDLLRGSCDFLGINHYKTVMAKRRESEKYDAFTGLHNVHLSFAEDWTVIDDQYTVVPWGIRKVLNWIHEEYGKPTIFVTKNGMPHTAEDPNINDGERIVYITAYLNEILKAQTYDSVNVKGYFVWSLMDNFAWTKGYSVKFGLHYVNFTDPARLRLPRESAKAYSKIIQDGGFPSQLKKKEEL
ncbi:cytosolic beta-glucosidase-like [Ptychodera flava]|uniref:cytosolic beta-glucosidase-like n=1 Tax=Ptychodera flava TaxID=63121 RepID=UPI00396A495A